MLPQNLNVFGSGSTEPTASTSNAQMRDHNSDSEMDTLIFRELLEDDNHDVESIDTDLEDSLLSSDDGRPKKIKKNARKKRDSKNDDDTSMVVDVSIKKKRGRPKGSSANKTTQKEKPRSRRKANGDGAPSYSGWMYCGTPLSVSNVNGNSSMINTNNTSYPSSLGNASYPSSLDSASYPSSLDSTANPIMHFKKQFLNSHESPDTPGTSSENYIHWATNSNSSPDYRQSGLPSDSPTINGGVKTFQVTPVVPQTSSNENVDFATGSNKGKCVVCTVLSFKRLGLLTAFQMF